MSKYKTYKYLNDLGIKPQNQFTNFAKDEKRFKKERRIYGFDRRETYDIQYMFVEWLYQRLKMLKELTIVDMTQYKVFIYGKAKTVEYWVDTMIEQCEYILKLRNENRCEDSVYFETIKSITYIFSECSYWLGW